jgi:uncharacterized protein DUF2637
VDKRWQSVAVGVSVALGLVVFGYGMAGSYVTVSELAARRGVPLAAFVPAGIDGGLINVVMLDLVLVWVGAPVGWLRQVVRVLSVGTIAANTVTGWPDPVAVGLHAAAPTMLLAMIEAGRTVLLRRLGVVLGTARDAIPVQRWLLASWRTALLRRRMDGLVADHQLPDCGGSGVGDTSCGGEAAPALWTWLATAGARRSGVDAADRCRGQRGMHPGRGVGPCPGREHAACPGPDCPPSTPIAPIDDAGTASLSHTMEKGDGRFAEAARLNREHWTQTGRPISAETLRKRLHLGARTSRAWSRIIRAADQAAVCGPS